MAWSNNRPATVSTAAEISTFGPGPLLDDSPPSIGVTKRSTSIPAQNSTSNRRTTCRPWSAADGMFVGVVG